MEINLSFTATGNPMQQNRFTRVILLDLNHHTALQIRERLEPGCLNFSLA
jgi:hypothetical protein